MRLRSKIVYAYAALVAVFIIITVVPTPTQATLSKYHLNAMQVRLLDITLLVPLVGAWVAVYYGYAKLQRYGQLIKENTDGKQVNRLAWGLFMLAIGLPLSSIVEGTLAFVARTHPGFLSASVIIPNYISVAYTLIAFLFIYSGSRALNEPGRNRPSPGFSHFLMLLAITLGVVFCALIARERASIQIAYHMSFTWAMLTLGIPYIYAWFLGLFAIAEMYEYSKRVAGVVYRKGWDILALGLGAVIVFNIILQYLETLSSWLDTLHLAGVLLLLYVLLFLLAGAFIVVALGTRQLMKIEEV